MNSNLQEAELAAAMADDPSMSLTAEEVEPSVQPVDTAQAVCDADAGGASAPAVYDFAPSPAGTDAYSTAVPPTGPYLVKGSKLPENAPPVADDIQKYLDDGNNSPALEFLSPVKGPALEQITVAVATGQVSPEDGAKQYDADVTPSRPSRSSLLLDPIDLTVAHSPSSKSSRLPSSLTETEEVEEPDFDPRKTLFFQVPFYLGSPIEP